MPPTVLRRQSWKGSKESLAPQRHSSLMNDGMIYRPSSPGPQSDLSRPATFPQNLAAAASGQRVNPPLPRQVRSITPPPSSWDSNPSTKRYSGNLDYLVPRLSPVPQGPRPDGLYKPSIPGAARDQSGACGSATHHHAKLRGQTSSPSLHPGPRMAAYKASMWALMAVAASHHHLRIPCNQTNRQSPTAQQMQSSALASTLKWSQPSPKHAGAQPQ